nr:hypothetical protein [Tanacetum cinerariifolium]
MRRIGKGFSGVDTPLFDAMLVQQQVHDDVAKVEEDEDNEVSPAPTPPSPTPATTPPPPQQEPIPSPPQAQSAQPSLVTDIIKGIKSKQSRTKPSIKQKAWKIQKSTKVNKK